MDFCTFVASVMMLNVNCAPERSGVSFVVCFDWLASLSEFRI